MVVSSRTALARTVLERRLAPRPAGRLDIVSMLRHFALITYALPRERLTPHIPEHRFEIPTFDIDGEPRALMSAVPFVDSEFRFARLLPFVRFRFCQTNYRVYVIDRESGEHVVWFFGTTLGGWPVHLARWLWRIPWHWARYRCDCHYDHEARRYSAFRYRTRARWAAADIDIADTGAPVEGVPGFADRDEATLVLTHPVDGYYYRLNRTLGTYSVSHDLLALTRGEPRNLYFSLFERLGLLTRDEMQRPHSIFLCPETVFHIYMPPRRAA